MKGGDTKKRKTEKGKTKENKSAARLLTATIPAAADGVIAGITKLEPSHAHRVRVMQPGSRGDLVPGSNRHHHTGATSSVPPAAAAAASGKLQRRRSFVFASTFAYLHGRSVPSFLKKRPFVFYNVPNYELSTSEATIRIILSTLKK